MLYSIIGMLVIIFDQLVKFWVDRNINWTNPSRPLIPGIISLVRVQNDGAAFSFLSGSGARVWFIVLTGVFALLVVIALATHFISGKFGRWCLVLVTAGGLSNMIDRIRYGFVIDMFKVELFDFAVFNVADIFITVFCIAFILYILFGGEKQREVDVDEFDEIDYEEEDRPKRSAVKKSARRDDDYEDRSVTRAPVKKPAPRKPADDYDDDEYDDEDVPVRRTNRSAAAAANAYKRKPAEAAEEKMPQPKRPQRPVQDAPSQPRQRRSVSQAETSAPESRAQRLDASRRNAADPEIEKMLSSEPSVQRQRKASTAAAPSVQRKPAASSAAPQKRPSPQTEAIPVYDPNNPFAEWEQANARVSGKTEFSSFTDKEEKLSAPDLSSSAQKINKSFSSDFDLDDILNEFK